ncbi:uncharacterized protein N7459_006306 [Penicillium hispanicum]|uniref:uncharacterized protein n=1 Tax=Penicillium hispanicum TaxID=1080232 RepID=UPI0025417265|nr:uncharacterized protein N7459_006306 [Penicillium hispanicum]KAJ5580321.1 hypothetical protein N7459_006306 [Penicillium hispanicum]
MRLLTTRQRDAGLDQESSLLSQAFVHNRRGRDHNACITRALAVFGSPDRRWGEKAHGFEDEPTTTHRQPWNHRAPTGRPPALQRPAAYRTASAEKGRAEAPAFHERHVGRPILPSPRCAIAAR